MNEAKRATVYFEADVHRALCLKAAATDRSISDMEGRRRWLRMPKISAHLTDEGLNEVFRSSPLSVA